MSSRGIYRTTFRRLVDPIRSSTLGVLLYVSETKGLRSSCGHGVDWRTGVDFQHTGSFTHITKFLSCPWERDPWGTRNISFVSCPYSFPQHCMPSGSPLEQGCLLIFSISNKHTQERDAFAYDRHEKQSLFPGHLQNLLIFIWHLKRASTTNH